MLSIVSCPNNRPPMVGWSQSPIPSAGLGRIQTGLVSGSGAGLDPSGGGADRFLKATATRPIRSVHPVHFAAHTFAKPRPVLISGGYTVGDPYLSQANARLLEVHTAVRGLSADTKQLGDLPLVWAPDHIQPHIGSRPMDIPTIDYAQFPYYDLERPGLFPMSLRAYGPTAADKLFVNFTNDRHTDVRNQYAIIQTQQNGQYITPLNGIASAYVHLLEANHIAYTFHTVDMDKVDRFLQAVLGEPAGALNEGWGGRDVSATIAGAMIGGLDPKTFAKTSTPTKPETMPETPKFIAHVTPINGMPKVGDVLDGMGLVDGGRDIKLSLTTTKAQARELIQAGAHFKLTANHRAIDHIALANKYQDVAEKQGVLISSSTYGLQPGQYLLELGIRQGDVLDTLKIHPDHTQAFPVQLERVS